MADYSILAGADDGYVSGPTTNVFDATGTGASFGMGTYPNHAFLRFDGIVADQGDTCTTATLTVRAAATLSGTVCNARIYCNDHDDAVAPTTAAEYLA
ncbi:MAG TPA: hypothetical protein VM243_10270, partial [Phycisphaerae bacterium]|nr:hypothetical protein [Phycisphaerae bacterium]